MAGNGSGREVLWLWAVCVFVALIDPSSGERVKRADDVDKLHALQTLVQQQGSLLQLLQAKQTELEAQQSECAAKQSTLSAEHDLLKGNVTALRRQNVQVGFTVHFSHDNESNGVPLGPGSIVCFDSIVTNTGGFYDPATGVFMAPANGLYAFVLNVMAPNAHGFVVLAIEKHGTVLGLAYAEGVHDRYDQGSSHVTAHLTTGDQVWVRQQNGDAVRGSWWTVFTGFLIQAD